MKKLISLMTFVLLSTLSFAQGNGNQWYIPTQVVPTITADGVDTKNVYLRIDFAGRYCTDCSPSGSNPPTVGSFKGTFKVTNLTGVNVPAGGTAEYPIMTINGVQFNFHPDGLTGYAQNVFVNASVIPWSQNGYYWSAGLVPLQIKGGAAYPNTYSGTWRLELINFSDVAQTPGCGFLSNSYTVPNTILTFEPASPPPPVCQSSAFRITSDRTALAGPGEYATLTITNPDPNWANTGTELVGLTRLSGPVHSVTLSKLSGSISCGGPGGSSETVIYKLTQNNYPVGACTYWRVTLRSVSNNTVNPSYKTVDIMCCPQNW